MIEKKERIGEVVHASTSLFSVQCHVLYGAPGLGALVSTGSNNTIYGVVAEVSTNSIDPGRRPMVMGQDQESIESVYKQNPQLSRLLTTEFQVLVVGHIDNNGELQRYLAPIPPKIHELVYVCQGSEVIEIARSLEMLPALLSSPVGSPDELTAAFLRFLANEHDDPKETLLRSGRDLAKYLIGEFPRLSSILKRVSL